LLCPGLQCGLHDKDFEGERRVPVGGNYIGKFTAGIAAALSAIPFEKIILIDVAVGGRVALDPANGIRTRHARIIGGQAREVNAGICDRAIPI